MKLREKPLMLVLEYGSDQVSVFCLDVQTLKYLFNQLTEMIFGLLITLSMLIVSDSLRYQYKNAADKNVVSILGTGDLREVEITATQEYYLFESENSNNGTMVIFSSAKGRFENFDYMIIINKSLEIINIKILKYRSEYGYEITNKGWLKQFYGKPSTRFEYKRNVDALSGASFSANSLVNDVNLILDHLKK
jgi:Na+-translocating ferredoxin:NAD+ oxidoreductase RnfG subunit